MSSVLIKTSGGSFLASKSAIMELVSIYFIETLPL